MFKFGAQRYNKNKYPQNILYRNHTNYLCNGLHKPPICTKKIFQSLTYRKKSNPPLPMSPEISTFASAFKI